ncbi:GNAT family N-acetyltransferase [Methanoculleus frigidifontis]|nr:GNAT family N-acetyltransferase [Methanoculleus sp. FWC-SCC1]
MPPRIVDVTAQNIDECPPTCFLNPKNEGYNIKREWLKGRFSEGLKVKVLYDETDGKIHGFIEYVPGEYAWRAVDAEGYLFIHCIGVSPNSYKQKGYGSDLIRECIKDADGKLGVAVVASDGPFMATRNLFLKNGFAITEEDGKDQLLVKPLKEGLLPKFRDYREQLGNYQGWQIVYSNQCPWVARFISELDPTIVDRLELTLTQFETAEQAQNAPSIYAVFNLIHDGTALADRYISQTRLKNILKKHAAIA